MENKPGIENQHTLDPDSGSRGENIGPVRPRSRSKGHNNPYIHHHHHPAVGRGAGHGHGHLVPNHLKIQQPVVHHQSGLVKGNLKDMKVHGHRKYERADHPLRLLTYNIFMRPVIGYKSDLKDERLPEINDAILQFDIVCFQELFPHFNNRRIDLMKFANRCFYKYASVPPSPGFFNMLTKGSLLNSGLLTISKYPIVHTEFEAFKYKAGVDSLAMKGVMYSKIKMPNHYNVHVFNTHTQATYNNDYQPTNKSDHKNFFARLKQIEEVRAFVCKMLKTNSRLEKDKPEKFKDLVIIAGDFNVNSLGKNLPKENFNELAWVADHPGATFSEYDYMIGVLSGKGADKLIDLAFESYGRHPVTYADFTEHADGSKTPKESKLTSMTEHLSAQSLDYLFQFIPSPEIAPTPAFKLEPKNCKVNEFFVQNDKFTQLSDHYGIECVFEALNEEGVSHVELTASQTPTIEVSSPQDKSALLQSERSNATSPLERVSEDLTKSLADTPITKLHKVFSEEPNGSIQQDRASTINLEFKVSEITEAPPEDNI